MKIPIAAANEPESGTRVTVKIEGVREKPILPAWESKATPALPVSQPKVDRE